MYSEDTGLAGLTLLAVFGLVAYGAYYIVALVSHVELVRGEHRHPTTGKLLARCSLLRGRYWPSPWIFSGHLDVPLSLFISFQRNIFCAFPFLEKFLH